MYNNKCGYYFVTDFPGMCFASTRCATVEPGANWDLSPFCGRSTCVVSEDEPPRLLELVEDCGPLPLANPKCKLDTGMIIRLIRVGTYLEKKSRNDMCLFTLSH